MTNYETIVICNALAVLSERYGLGLNLTELYKAIAYSAEQLGMTADEATTKAKLDIMDVVRLLEPTTH